MNALTTFDPFDQLLPDVLRRFGRRSLFRDDVPMDIPLDVTEHDKDYEVRAQLPGLSKDDVKVTVDGNFVSIVAEVRKEKEEKEKSGRRLMKEIYVGSASRGFTLAHEIDAKNVQAKLDNGVLKLTLPKRDGAGSRLIPVA